MHTHMFAHTQKKPPKQTLPRTKNKLLQPLIKLESKLHKSIITGGYIRLLLKLRLVSRTNRDMKTVFSTYIQVSLRAIIEKQNKYNLVEIIKSEERKHSRWRTS